MFLSAVQPYIVAIIIAVVVVQYAFALFCLLKLAYLDIAKKYYILWNVFILIVFFIGGAVFLIYYYKHPELKLPNASTGEQKIEHTESPEQSDRVEQAEQPEGKEQTENTEHADVADDEQAEQSDNGEQSE